VVSYKGRLLQIRTRSPQYAPARSKVTVCESQDGRLKIYYRDQVVEWEEIQQRPAKSQPVPTSKPATHRRVTIPPPQHPWKQKSFEQMLARKQRAAHKT